MTRELSVLDWARERLANTHCIAAEKQGADRAGWLEDAWYWQQIVEALSESAAGISPSSSTSGCSPTRTPADLRAWAQHKNECAKWGPVWEYPRHLHTEIECTCGLREALQALSLVGVGIE